MAQNAALRLAKSNFSEFSMFRHGGSERSEILRVARHDGVVRERILKHGGSNSCRDQRSWKPFRHTGKSLAINLSENASQP